jgi:hypothetical protein
MDGGFGCTYLGCTLQRLKIQFRSLSEWLGIPTATVVLVKTIHNINQYDQTALETSQI